MNDRYAMHFHGKNYNIYKNYVKFTENMANIHIDNTLRIYYNSIIKHWRFFI